MTRWQDDVHTVGLWAPGCADLIGWFEERLWRVNMRPWCTASSAWCPRAPPPAHPHTHKKTCKT
eukprot:scaffold10005_cov167-Isochrysis_galbana.AAC.2